MYCGELMLHDIMCLLYGANELMLCGEETSICLAQPFFFSHFPSIKAIIKAKRAHTETPNNAILPIEWQVMVHWIWH